MESLEMESGKSAIDSMYISIELNYTTPHSTTELIIPSNGNITELPIDMQFNDGHRLAITIYSLLMFFSGTGNIYAFTSIVRFRRKGKLSRINLFLLHLTIADLLVTFLMMPLEIAWHYTVSWQAGDFVCRIMSFFRIFGLYLSGFVLISISLDLFFAVVKPLGIGFADVRAKWMLGGAWIASLFCSLPQSIIFHVEKHPKFNWYEQCITFNAFPSREYELAYNLFSFFFLYVFPLTMIIFCYSCILYEIYRVNKKKSNDKQLRRSNTEALDRAKVRTLKMTVTIVLTFFFCWTPYNVMSLWYWFDKKSAQGVDQRIQKGFFLFACTNSCLNPLIYGFFHFRRNQKSIRIPILTRTLHGNKHNTEVQWKPNGCCRVVAEIDSATDVFEGSTTQTRDKHMTTADVVLLPTSEVNSSRTLGNGCSRNTFQLLKPNIKETQI